MTPPQRTLGQALSGIEMSTAAMLGGLALVAIGSVGPWVTASLGSQGGLNGDGKWTILLAAVAAFILVRRGEPDIRAGLICMVILGLGVYDAAHIQHVLARVTVLGTQIDHVGWGVYAVIVGALVTLGVMVREHRLGPRG